MGTVLRSLIFLAFLLVCASVAAGAEEDGHDHSGHDHDHEGHDHSEEKEEKAGDHSGHDHSGHDHGDHDGFIAEDIEGEYDRFLAFPGSETTCPVQIAHGAPEANPEDPDGMSYIVPHSSITHDGVACEGDGSMLIMPIDMALALPEVQESLAQAPIVKQSAERVKNQTSAMYGIDREGRTCGGSSLPAGVGYLLIHDMDADVELVPGSVSLPAGLRYMAVFAPLQGSMLGCIYNATHVSHGGSDSTEGGSSTATTASPSATTVSGAATTAAAGATTTTEDDGVCFPSDARVALESGDVVSISSLRVGDRVAVGGGRFSDVFGFTHADPTARSVFVQMTTVSGATLSATPGHYVHVSGALKAARDVRVGDALELEDGSADVVVQVSEAILSGLYNPQTIDGSIMVEGFRASTYTQAVEPALAHAALAPLRSLFSFFGVSPLSLPFGANTVANLLPSGDALVQ